MVGVHRMAKAEGIGEQRGAEQHGPVAEGRESPDPGGDIGENDAAIRSEIAEGCRWLGLQLDDTRNKNGMTRISADTSHMSAWVVPTDEELMMARHTVSVLGLRNMEAAQ